MPAPYDVLYIDPPWSYDNKKTGGSHKSGAAQKYDCLSMEQLTALPIKSIAAWPSVCALWCTTPFGGDPYELLKTWGFKYKTELYWHKTGRKGTGYWLRGCVEKLLIGTRGDVKAWRSNIDNWTEFPEMGLGPIEAMPTGHSQKPEAVIRMLEQVTPQAKNRVELFATQHSAALANKGDIRWDCYGLDLGHDFCVEDFWTMLIQEAHQKPSPPTLSASHSIA